MNEMNEGGVKNRYREADR